MYCLHYNLTLSILCTRGLSTTGPRTGSEHVVLFFSLMMLLRLLLQLLPTATTTTTITTTTTNYHYRRLQAYSYYTATAIATTSTTTTTSSANTNASSCHQRCVTSSRRRCLRRKFSLWVLLRLSFQVPCGRELTESFGAVLGLHQKI